MVSEVVTHQPAPSSTGGKIFTIMQRVKPGEFAQKVFASSKLLQKGCDEMFTFQPKRSKPSPSWQGKWVQLAVPTRAWVRTSSHVSPLFCQALMLHRWHQPNPGTQTRGTAKLWTMKNEGPMGINRKFTNNSQQAVAQKACQPDSSKRPRHSFFGLALLILKTNKRRRSKYS